MKKESVLELVQHLDKISQELGQLRTVLVDQLNRGMVPPQGVDSEESYQVWQVVTEYLDALVARDAAAANRIARVNVKNPQSVYLAPEVYSRAVPITDPLVVSIDFFNRGVVFSGREAQVNVTYRVDGESYKQVLHVDRDKDGWWVSQGLTFSPPHASRTGQSGLDFTFAGSTVAASAVAHTAKVYPGVYTLVAPNRFFDLSGELSFAVTTDYSILPDTGVTLVPSAGYIQAVQDVVDRHFEETIHLSTLEELSATGIDVKLGEIYRRHVALVTNVTVVSRPIVHYSESDYRPFKATDGLVIVALSGKDFQANHREEECSGTYSVNIQTQIAGDDLKVTLSHH